MRTKTCGTCRWWEELYEEADAGACHIRSTPDYFPQRTADNWCGEWTPKEPDAPETLET